MSATGDLIEEANADARGYADECDRLRGIVETLGDALADLIGDVGNRNMVDWPAGGQVPASWGQALMVLDDVYIEHLEAEERRLASEEANRILMLALAGMFPDGSKRPPLAIGDVVYPVEYGPDSRPHGRIVDFDPDPTNGMPWLVEWPEQPGQYPQSRLWNAANWIAKVGP